MRWLVCCVLMIPLVCQATIYRWVDKQGNEHFSDQPRAGAKKIKVPPAQTYKSTKFPNIPVPALHVPGIANNYQSITIERPLANETIRNNIGLVDVTVRLKPDLAEGDKVVLIVDGQAVGESATSNHFTIQNLTRGTHHVSAKVVDANGKTLMSSGQTTFYMQRNRINMSQPLPPKPTPLSAIKNPRLPLQRNVQ